MIINAAGLKELKSLSPAVFTKVDALKKHYRLRKVGFSAKAANYQYYLAEGAECTFYAPNGNVCSAKMVSESTLGAANDGLNYHVGKFTPELPEGTWIVEFEIFLGKPMISVIYVSALQLS